jgi:hypothetical protein
MAARTGVQYASVTVKRCPMFDDACAARVIEQIAKQYPLAYGACDCDAQGRREADARACAQAHTNDPEKAVPVIFAMYNAPLVHADSCASRVPIPFDARGLVEEKCGRYTRGAHKGQLRGWASISVVTVGGWMKYGPGERNGRVVYPGSVVAISIGDDFSGKTYLEVR